MQVAGKILSMLLNYVIVRKTIDMHSKTLGHDCKDE